MTLKADAKFRRRLKRLLDRVMVNETLVREGLAIAHAYRPDVKHQERLFDAQRDAQKHARGIWASAHNW